VRLPSERRSSTRREANGLQHGGGSVGVPSIGCCGRRQSLREHLLATVRHVTEEAADAELKAHAQSVPWSVREPTTVPTMDAPASTSTRRASSDPPTSVGRDDEDSVREGDALESHFERSRAQRCSVQHTTINIARCRNANECSTNSPKTRQSPISTAVDNIWANMTRA